MTYKKDFILEELKMKRFEIYFDDLNEEAQKRLMKEFDTTPEEENWEICPLTEVDREEFLDEN